MYSKVENQAARAWTYNRQYYNTVLFESNTVSIFNVQKHKILKFYK